MPDLLTAARLELFAFGRDECRLRASSAGKVDPALAGRVQPLPGLFRADLLLTGVSYSNGSSMRGFPFTLGHFATRVAAWTIWRTATAWP
jgi:hypothetical protein